MGPIGTRCGGQEAAPGPGALPPQGGASGASPAHSLVASAPSSRRAARRCWRHGAQRCGRGRSRGSWRGDCWRHCAQVAADVAWWIRARAADAAGSWRADFTTLWAGLGSAALTATVTATTAHAQPTRPTTTPRIAACRPNDPGTGPEVVVQGGTASAPVAGLCVGTPAWHGRAAV